LERRQAKTVEETKEFRIKIDKKRNLNEKQRKFPIDIN
jgi:hypothetical protein